ncbi:hypothetical protein Plhal304r1_c021g0075211 [Plasmopara halstedii]
MRGGRRVCLNFPTVCQLTSQFAIYNPESLYKNNRIMPKSAHTVEIAPAEDHAAMKKQWQTNLEIDLLKSAWIRKDREQHGAHTSPPLSAAK